MLVEAERRAVEIVVADVAGDERVRRPEQRIGLIEGCARKRALGEIRGSKRIKVAWDGDVRSRTGRNFGRREADVGVGRDDRVTRAQERFPGRDVVEREGRSRRGLLDRPGVAVAKRQRRRRRIERDQPRRPRLEIEGVGGGAERTLRTRHADVARRYERVRLQVVTRSVGGDGASPRDHGDVSGGRQNRRPVGERIESDLVGAQVDACRKRRVRRGAAEQERRGRERDGRCDAGAHVTCAAAC